MCDASTFTTILDRLLGEVQTMVSDFDVNVTPIRLEEFVLLLEMAPLTKIEFDAVLNRVRRIQRFSASGESGAAKYEIRLLLFQMERSAARP